MEEWRDVPGFENLYQVSNYGRVRRIYNGKVKVMTQRHRGKGYLGVTLIKNSIKKDSYVHRLVAETFIPNQDNLPQVNHKNLNKEDNSVDNLEWVTAIENMRHRYKYGAPVKRVKRKRCTSFRKRKNTKKIKQYLLDGTYVQTWDSLLQIQNTLGFYHSNISACCKGVTRKSHGYIWSYE